MLINESCSSNWGRRASHVINKSTINRLNNLLTNLKPYQIIGPGFRCITIIHLLPIRFLLTLHLQKWLFLAFALVEKDYGKPIDFFSVSEIIML